MARRSSDQLYSSSGGRKTKERLKTRYPDQNGTAASCDYYANRGEQRGERRLRQGGREKL
ncbi:hypothetical protein JCGZ_00190 [Jatropha curcas]|uniref:Uncharacterized protein n=1 Tax=Jatropha curcas TaxID=180498 RepID=A0A067JK74_JATCU|nr:hypothetical protein JCGZ_00190 [Jatropha curcas]